MYSIKEYKYIYILSILWQGVAWRDNYIYIIKIGKWKKNIIEKNEYKKNVTGLPNHVFLR